MAFPVVQSRATGRTTTTNTTSHPITLPAGITNGDLLLVIFSVDQIPDITPVGTKWVFYGFDNDATSAVTSVVFWKIADGSDTLTITTSTAEQSSHISLRISGASGLVGNDVTGSSTNSNPPNLAMPYGAQDYLWIAARSGDSTVTATAAPASYSTLTTIAAAGTGGASTNTAERSLNASSEDPGTFTSTTEQWVAWTIGIVPTLPVIQNRDINWGNNQNTTTLTADAPVAVNGDLLVAFVCCAPAGNIANVTPPAGWTQVGASATTASAPHARVYWRIANNEPASYTWAAEATANSQVVTGSFYGVDTSNPFQVTPTWTSNAANSTTHTAPSATLTAAGVLLTLYGAINDGTYTAPAGMTQLIEISDGAAVAQQAALEYRAASGATGTRAATYSPTSVSVAGSLALLQGLNATNAAAGNAAGTGAAGAPTVTAVTTVNANPGNAAGYGTASPGDYPNPGVYPGDDIYPGGSGPTAKIGPNAGNAAGTGAANAPSVSTTGNNTTTSAGHAAGAGAANTPTPTVGPNGGAAAGSGTSQTPTVKVTSNAGVATGVGVANPPGTSATVAFADVASGLGYATYGDYPGDDELPGADDLTTTIAPNAGNATGTGTANQPTPTISGITASAGNATGTGAAGAATVSVAAKPGNAAATGVAHTPATAVSVAAGNATGAGAAPGQTASPAATTGAVTGSGTAPSPTPRVAPNAGATAGTGAANTPTAAVVANPGAASGAGVANQPAVNTTSTTTVPAGAAAGTGTANQAAASVAPTAGNAAGTGAANNPAGSVEIGRAHV